MGDLGMHVLHLPLRFGWRPHSIHAVLSNIIKERVTASGEKVSCDTWDNAYISCEVKTEKNPFPMILSFKRMAPGHNNTWFIRIEGTKGSIEYSTKCPKQLKYMSYRAGKEQAWQVLDVNYESAYKMITGPIFKFGFSDSILQMWASFCEEAANGGTSQPLYCVTPEETAESHRIFTAALESYKRGEKILV
ncbi:hypothetical protein ACFOU2_19955 [Bacillus songklensis]|uniref:Gfo/Idh/MocA-like oxidoreductase C-terminal domain-containing protein n=1 Tax=Bacillus songklensis TaxID=1069116 RepID=A0ABV8B6V8_9BACI